MLQLMSFLFYGINHSYKGTQQLVRSEKKNPN